MKGFTSILRIPLTLVLVLTVAGYDAATGQATRDAPVAAETVPAGFASATASVNGTILHYVAGGRGPALILIHGFPENWSAYAEIMPGLASRFRVVAVDLRGIGGSMPTERGYDAATMAEDVHQLAQQLGLDRPYIVGHDFGGWVAYALARLHPSMVRGAMILDIPIAGVEPWEKVKIDPRLWHFGFHRAPGLAEKLLAGREAIYIGYFLRRTAADPKSIRDEDVERYARAYSRPGQMAAAMGMYRAFDENERFGKERRGPLDVPLTLVAGGNSFGTLLPTIAKGLEDTGARSVAAETISGSGHYILDTNPADVAALIERYATGAVPK
jgi:pimeloyl-ACP methyl ester carboxylesterase